jgi:ligand-binding sensor domain-containing protein/serine phosphatase RsbU (regulator of sigma subunit)
LELNPTGGYRINHVTGDSILPIVNSRGDIVTTGESLPVHGRVIDPAAVAVPRVTRAGDPREVAASLYVHPVPGNLTIKPVQVTDLLAESGEEERSAHFLLNSTGDTLITGQPFPVTGKQVPCVQPRPVPTMPPGIKDRASMDIKYLDVYHGMISSQVISLTEDLQGNIWFGSTGGGAARYDGNTLSVYGDAEGLSGSWITSILNDSRGNLWFGTVGEGVILFDGDTFIHFTEREGLSNNTIEVILEDSMGNIWLGTAGGGACRYDGKHMTCYSLKEGLDSNWVLSITEDSQGQLWFGTSGGLCLFNDGVFSQYRAEGEITRNPVNAILEDRQGNVWIGTTGAGVRRYKDGTFTCFTEKEGLSSNNIESILEDQQGNIWFGTRGGGVSMYNGTGFTHFTQEEGLSGNWVIAMLEDSSGNLWFGTVGDGVSIYNGHRFQHFTENDGLSSRAIYSILEDSKGVLWFGSMFGGVNRYDGVSFTYFSEKEGLSNLTVESIMEDHQGNIWFGAGSGGVSMYNGSTFTHFNAESGFSSYSVGSMLEDQHGTIWFGTYGGGLISYDGERFTHFTEDNGLSNNLVEALIEDSRGNLWIGTLGGGVSVYNGESIIHMGEKEGLSSSVIGSILEDSRGDIWIGTMTAGVCRLRDQSITFFTEREGLSNNHIQSIVEDNAGNIWLSTDQGLNLIEYQPGNELYSIHSFGLQDGLKGMQFLQNSVLTDSHNRIWWGSNKSLTMLDMNNFRISKKPPVLHFNRIDINGQFIDFRQPGEVNKENMEFDSVARFYNYPFNLKLSYHQKHLTFHYSAIEWSAPYAIKYSFRMEGISQQWSPPTSETKAEYRNLPNGTFTFKVRSIGEAQIWSEPVEYTFTISPPWWNSRLARAGYIVVAVLLIFGIVQWRTYRLKIRQKELQETIRERTVEISEKNHELKQQNINLAAQRDEIDAQKMAITDSIEYARRIQAATLPPDEVLKYLFPKHFILYRPLQIVSGDFYWLTQKRGKIIIAVADCTGHGVPGAFMSMLGSALLNDIVNNMDSLQASLILNELRDRVIVSLRQTGEADEARDGMDIALCIVDREQMELQYAGANNPLYHISEGKLTVVKADMMPIGISSEAGKSFTNHTLAIKKDDAVYLFSDGYPDQVGGEKRKRFKTSRLKSLLLEVQDRIMFDQKTVLESTLNEWMGHTGLYGTKYGQIDDILVMGIKI